MASYSLDDIRATADAKYGSFDVSLSDGTVVVLRNALRMPKAERDELMALQEATKSASEDGDGGLDEASIPASLRLIAANKKHADLLLAEIGDDMAVMLALFEAYQESTQAGEASASAT